MTIKLHHVIRIALFAGIGVSFGLFVAGQGQFWMETCPELVILLAQLLALSSGFLGFVIARNPGRGPWSYDPERADEELKPVDGFCPVCRYQQGPRDWHCKECRVCIQEIDHHCYLLGICVGGRNYPQFFGMLWSATIFHGASCIATVVNLAMTGGEGGVWCQVALIIVSFVPGTLLGLLTGCHTVHFFRNQREPCASRFHRKVLSEPMPDFHSLLILRREKEEKDMKKKDGNDDLQEILVITLD